MDIFYMDMDDQELARTNKIFDRKKTICFITKRKSKHIVHLTAYK